jgi:Tol biopolymer transport system component/DNA-binding winged helix-turn-helix (wHTH) protein
VADCRKRLLWKNGAVVPLTPKAFEILTALIDARGRVVDKDELLLQVWGDVAVEDATLARHISTLRRALDERPTQHMYVVTVPGRGYEFVATIAEAEEPASPPPPAVHADAVRAPSTVPAPAARAPTSAIVIAGALALIVAIAALYELEFRVGRSPLPQRGLRQFTFRGGLQREAAWSPDGQWIAYTSDAAGSSDIWIQRIGEPQGSRVSSSPSEDSQPSWSPDSRRIVFRSERDGGGLYVVTTNGNPERRIAEFGYRPKWSPDGTLVLFASSGHVGGSTRMYLVGADGGTPDLLRPDLLAEVTIADAEWAPDGTGVSIWGRARNGTWTFLTVPIARGPAVTAGRDAALDRQIAGGQLTLGRFAWARSGRYLFFEGLSEQVRNLWRIAVAPSTGTWLSAERLTTGAGPDGDITVSPDGMRLMFSARSSRTRLWAYPFDGVASRILGPGEPVTSGGGSEQDAESPADGSRLVYSAMRGGRQEFWERSFADGHERLLLSSTGWNLTRPRWSHDGQQLAYLRRRATAAANQADSEVMVLPINGQARALTRPGQVDMVPSDWSPDGAWLLGSCRTGTPARLGACVLPVFDGVVSASALRLIASDLGKNIFESRFSPDQRWISFMAVDRTDARVSRVNVVPAAGGGWRPVTEGLWYDDKPHWSRDGRTLYFLSDRSGMFNLWARHFDPDTGTVVGEPFQVTSFASPRQTISGELTRSQIAVTSTHLVLPLTESAGELWILDGVDR